jgi:PIN domain nuclease of toxin-antitoxin system
MVAARGCRKAKPRRDRAAPQVARPRLHRDLANRLIVAAARTMGGRVLTCDGRILAYAEAGHVAAVAY